VFYLLEAFNVKVSIQNLYNVSGVGRILRYSEYLKSGRILTEAIVRKNSEALSFFHFNLRFELKVHGPVAGFYCVIKHRFILL
jgi:hypothetical protein